MTPEEIVDEFVWHRAWCEKRSKPGRCHCALDQRKKQCLEAIEGYAEKVRKTAFRAGYECSENGWSQDEALARARSREAAARSMSDIKAALGALAELVDQARESLRKGESGEE